MDGDDVLAHDTHDQDDGQQQPFDRFFPGLRVLSLIQAADNRAGQLLRQAGVGDCHCESPQHRIRQRDLRPAFQAFVKSGNNAGLSHFSRHVRYIFQRHSCHQSADERADCQAQHYMYAR